MISDHTRRSVDLGDDEATLIGLSALVASQDIEPGDEGRRGGMADRALRRAYLYATEGLLIVLRSLPVWRAISEIDQPRFLNA